MRDERVGSVGYWGGEEREATRVSYSFRTGSPWGRGLPRRSRASPKRERAPRPTSITDDTHVYTSFLGSSLGVDHNPPSRLAPCITSIHRRFPEQTPITRFDMSPEPSPIGSPMPDTAEISPDHIFTFKSIAGVQHGGCRALVWLPTEISQDQTLPVAL